MQKQSSLIESIQRSKELSVFLWGFDRYEKTLNIRFKKIRLQSRKYEACEFFYQGKMKLNFWKKNAISNKCKC